MQEHAGRDCDSESVQSAQSEIKDADICREQSKSISHQIKLIASTHPPDACGQHVCSPVQNAIGMPRQGSGFARRDRYKTAVL